MKKFFISLMVMLFFTAPIPCQTDDHIKDAQDQLRELIELYKKQQQPDLQWNRYETKNFEILSIDDKQGAYLSKNIENIRLWLFYRWGIKDVDFPRRCKVMLVPDKQLFKKMFGKEVSSSKYDVKGSAIWLITDTPRWHTSLLTPLMTAVCMGEFEARYGVKFSMWMHRGMAVLNGNLNDIRSEFAVGSVDIQSRLLMTTTTEAYSKMTEDGKRKFDRECAVLCLMIYKDKGIKLFLDFMDESRVDPERAIGILNLQGYAGLDAVLSPYFANLSREIQAGRTPNSHLTW